MASHALRIIFRSLWASVVLSGAALQMACSNADPSATSGSGAEPTGTAPATGGSGPVGAGGGGGSSSAGPDAGGGGTGSLPFEPATGFAAEATTWSTPDGGRPGRGFYLVAGAAYDPGDNVWTTMDIDGDAKPDLVVTAKHGDEFGSDGHRFWKVYRGTP